MMHSTSLAALLQCTAIALFMLGSSVADAQYGSTSPSNSYGSTSSSNPYSSGATLMTPPSARPANSTPPGVVVKPGEEPKNEDGKPDDSKPDDENEEESDDKKDGEDEGEEPDTSGPVSRPEKPDEPGDPAELEVRPDADGKIRFNFKGQTWPNVLEWLAEISHMSLDWQEIPGGYLNLVTTESYTIDETRDLVNRHLLDRGYTLLRHGEILTVVKLEELNPGMLPRVEPEELAERDPYEFVKVSFRLESIMSDAAVTELKPMLSKHGTLTSLAATNRLEAIDAVVNLSEIYAVLLHEQSESGTAQQVREFMLQYTRAEDIREQLLGLLGMSSGRSSGPTGPMNPQQMQMQMQMQMQQQQMQAAQQAAQRAAQQAAQNKGGGAIGPLRKPEIHIVVDQRRNCLLVNASPDRMSIVEQSIEMLDVPGGKGTSLLADMNRMQIYRLAVIDPQPLVSTLEEIGGLDPTTRLQVDTANRAIIAYASLADHVMIRALIDKLDGSGRQFEVIPLRHLEADYVAGTISFMMGNDGNKKDTSSSSYGMYGGYFDPYGRSSRQSPKQSDDKFRVDADVEYNRLLLWANDLEIEEVVNLLVKLGEIPPEGDPGRTLRVLDDWGRDDAKNLMDAVRLAWPSIAPNQLILPELQTDAEADTDAGAGDPASTPVSGDTGTGSESDPATDGEPAGNRPDEQGTTDDQGKVAVLSEVNTPWHTQQRVDPSVPNITGTADYESSKASYFKTVQLSRNATSPESFAVQSGSQPPSASLPSEMQPNNAPPVRISLDSEGRLVIASDDPVALDRLEDLLAELSPQRPDYKIFRLKYAWAYGLKSTLDDFFEDKDKEENNRFDPYGYYGYGYGQSNNNDSEPSRLSKRRPMKIISDTDTNSLLVQGASPEQLAKIEELIEFYDTPEPTDSQSIRKTEMITLKYSEVKVVAEAIKEVYRDLLSENDKALGEQSKRQDSSRYYFYGDSEAEEKSPKFKGLLSIGIDELSNTLIISTPSFLMDDIQAMISTLDEAARPTLDVVRVVPTGQNGVSTESVHRILQEILAKKQAASKPNKKPDSPGDKPPQIKPR